MLSLGSGLLRQVHKGAHLLPLIRSLFLETNNHVRMDNRCRRLHSLVHCSPVSGATSWLGWPAGGADAHATVCRGALLSLPAQAGSALSQGARARFASLRGTFMFGVVLAVIVLVALGIDYVLTASRRRGRDRKGK